MQSNLGKLRKEIETRRDREEAEKTAALDEVVAYENQLSKTHNDAFKAARELSSPLAGLFAELNQAYKKDALLRARDKDYSHLHCHYAYLGNSPHVGDEDADAMLLHMGQVGFHVCVIPKIEPMKGGKTYALNVEEFSNDYSYHRLTDGKSAHWKRYYEGIHLDDAVSKKIHRSRDGYLEHGEGKFHIHAADSGKFVPYQYQLEIEPYQNELRGFRNYGTDMLATNPDYVQYCYPAQNPVYLALQINKVLRPDCQLSQDHIKEMVGPELWQDFLAYQRDVIDAQKAEPIKKVTASSLEGQLAPQSRGAARGAYSDTH